MKITKEENQAQLIRLAHKYLRENYVKPSKAQIEQNRSALIGTQSLYYPTPIYKFKEEN